MKARKNRRERNTWANDGEGKAKMMRKIWSTEQGVAQEREEDDHA